MKKLVLLFFVLLAVVLVVGFYARKQNGEFAESETTTVVTPLEEEGSEPLKVTDAAKPAVAEGVLAVTSLAGGTLETSKAYNVVRGTAPKNTYRIKVNDFTLTKYAPGQTQWSYIASTRFGTLKEGENDYTVRALDREGNEIAKTNFGITYNAPEVPVLPGTGSPLLAFLVTGALLAMGYFGLKRFTLEKRY